MPAVSKIEIRQGDIAAQKDLDAVVNAANAQLASGGGVAGAIHRAAGPELYEACKPLAPIKPGQAVLTPGFNLPNKYVIHCLGPVYGKDEPSNKLLADCYRNTLKIAEEKGIRKIGFPAISTGIFGYPKEKAAAAALKTIRETLESEAPGVEKVCMVLWGDEDVEVHRQALAALK